MQFSAYTGKALDQRADCLVVGVFEARALGSEGRSVDRAVGGRLKELLQRGDFAGRTGDSLLLTDWPGLRGSRLLLVGLGAAASYQRRAWKRALSAAMSALGRTRIRSANLAIERPADQDLDDYTFARSAAEA